MIDADRDAAQTRKGTHDYFYLNNKCSIFESKKLICPLGAQRGGAVAPWKN
jgi:hypothetical protein